MARHNEKAFKLNKAFNMAEAIMSTARGVAKALPNIPLAIAIGALGAVQIATIAKTKYQGRRLGGRMNKGEPYMVGEAGAEMVVPDAPSTVIPNSKLNSVSQPVTVNFNINTVDARGFNELLVNSRGTIVNLINSAVNEKGKMAIV
jgi:SLT domain-containing protein